MQIFRVTLCANLLTYSNGTAGGASLAKPNSVRSALRLQLGIPIKEIHPAFMQMVWRELASHVAQLFRTRLPRCLAQRHARPMQRLGALTQIARRTGRHNVLPTCHSARSTRHNVVKGQLALGTTILTTKFIPQKQIKAREGHALLRFYIVFEIQRPTVFGFRYWANVPLHHIQPRYRPCRATPP